MTSAATKPASSAGKRHTGGHGYGLILFAGVIVAWLGVMNMAYGIAAIANSHALTVNKAHYVFGTLHWWGWITLTLGALQLVAAAGVLLGNQLARWFGVAVVGLNAIGQMFFLPAYPWWSLVIIAVDLVALYGLCAHGGRAEADTVWADAGWDARAPQPGPPLAEG